MKQIFTLKKRFFAILIIALSLLQAANAQVTLDLKLYIQGYYIGGGEMRPVLFNSANAIGFSYVNQTDCDFITISMIDPVTSNVVESVQGMLHVNGLCTVTFNSVVVNNAYYISVCHRNSIQTTSTLPVTLTPITSYDFSTSQNQAYGGNMIDKLNDGVWAFYSGDLNLDCYIDVVDVTVVDNDNLSGNVHGYVCTDLTGDGFVNSLDFAVVDANNLLGVFCNDPGFPNTCICESNPGGLLIGSLITGSVYTDLDENCAFTNPAFDKGASVKMVKAEDNVNFRNFFTFTRTNGTYAFNLPPGVSYDVSLVNNSTTLETSSCTGTLCNSTVVNGRKAYCVETFPASSKDFFIQPTCVASVVVHGNPVQTPPYACGNRPSGTPCPGSKWNYCVTFLNNYKEFINGTLFQLDLDPAMSFTGVVPDLCGIAGTYDNSLKRFEWVASSCLNFPVGNSCTVCVEVTVNSIPAGGTWKTTARIGNNLSCCGENQNIPVSFTLQEGNRCSCDPNDMQVTPLGCGPQGIISPQELTYKVRFQNLGSGPAHNIIVVDTLSNELNLETFRMLASSHPITRIEILPGNVLKLIFIDIELPAEINDSAGSNGFVVFSLMPEAGLIDGTLITNGAAIYFDDNDPVLTNVVVNKIFQNPIVEAAILEGNQTVCNGSTATFTASEAPPYLWNTGATTRSITVSEHGTYNVVTNFGYPCEDTAFATLTMDSLQLIIVDSITGVTCHGENNGIIVVTASGGNGTYFYSANGGTTYQVSNVFSGLTVGTYYLRVKDSDNCTGSVKEVTITQQPCSIAITVKAFIQGYYIGNGRMDSVLMRQGVTGATETQVDTVMIELRHAIDFSLIDSYKGIMDIHGIVEGIFYVASVDSMYYIAIRHRNAVFTTSANPVLISNGTFYDFTTDPGKAYGNNLVDNYGDGKWSIYNGDVNQDEYVGTDDVTFVDNDNLTNGGMLVGYDVNDFNGDGYVGSDDVTNTDNNNLNIIFSQHP